MTDQQHPITPPLSLIVQWWDEVKQNVTYDEPIGLLIAAKAAQWGADQELEACCEWAKQFNYDDEYYQDKLRATRRPKPPSLKEQALAALDDAVMRGDCITISDAVPTIRRALEQLPND